MTMMVKPFKTIVDLRKQYREYLKFTKGIPPSTIYMHKEEKEYLETLFTPFQTITSFSGSKIEII